MTRFALISLLVLGACIKTKPDDACIVASNMTCVSFDDLDTAEQDCAAAGGESVNQCPEDGLVGICRTSGKVTQYYAPKTADDARMACEDVDGLFISPMAIPVSLDGGT